MKRSIFFKTALASATFFMIASCNSGSSNNTATNDTATTTKMADKKNDSTFNKAGEKDAKALVDAYNSSVMEARLSDSVSAVTKNEEVKTLATAMATAHGGLNAKIQDLASKKQITLPSDLSDNDKSKIASLTSEKPADMNKDYVDKLISAHKDAISDFEKDSSDVTDNDLKTLFINTLPELRKHLAMGEECKAHMKSMK